MPKSDDWELWSSLTPEEAVPGETADTWWVAHTKPRNEKALATELAGSGIVHYLPLFRRKTRSRNTGRTSNSILPVFPGYLFFMASSEERHRAMRTNRVAGTLVVPDQARLIVELRQLHRILRIEGRFELQKGLQVGQWVRVTSGPLEGTEGVIATRLSKLRLILNVEMLGQSVSLHVEENQLERIDGPSYPASDLTQTR
jgi:transcription antitermination factor NusG